MPLVKLPLDQTDGRIQTLVIEQVLNSQGISIFDNTTKLADVDRFIATIPLSNTPVVDCSISDYFTLTCPDVGNIVAFGTNDFKSGQRLQILFTQPFVGNKTISFNSQWSVNGTLNSAAYSKTLITITNMQPIGSSVPSVIVQLQPIA
jgi:hypothetical protein